jgi:hypothetical protein
LGAVAKFHVSVTEFADAGSATATTSVKTASVRNLMKWLSTGAKYNLPFLKQVDSRTVEIGNFQSGVT